jgi:hypothetical protein
MPPTTTIPRDLDPIIGTGLWVAARILDEPRRDSDGGISWAFNRLELFTGSSMSRGEAVQITRFVDHHRGRPITTPAEWAHADQMAENYFTARPSTDAPLEQWRLWHEQMPTVPRDSYVAWVPAYRIVESREKVSR